MPGKGEFYSPFGAEIIVISRVFSPLISIKPRRVGRLYYQGVSNVDYIIREELPSVETYRHIRVSAGLSDKTEQAAKTGLRNGLYSVVVCHQDAPVGMGRVIGDGGCFFVITDIAVLPQHHKKGVGDRIMTALMAWIARHAPPSAYISLIASHGSPGFYARYGFEPALLPERAGMFLRIQG